MCPPLQSCSFFNSNAVPLKLSFVNADALGSKVNVLFKMGDDLRQDILILQVLPLLPSHPHTLTPPLTISDLAHTTIPSHPHSSHRDPPHPHAAGGPLSHPTLTPHPHTSSHHIRTPHTSLPHPLTGPASDGEDMAARRTRLKNDHVQLCCYRQRPG